MKKTPIVAPQQVQHRLKNNKSKNTLKKKDSITPPDLVANTERKNNFSKTLDLGGLTGHQAERSPAFNTSRRSLSKGPLTIEEAQVPLNSAKRAMRKMEKSLDS